MFANRKILLLLISLLLIVAFPMSILASSPEIYQGSGTENDPYLIYSEEDLRKIGNDADWTLDKSYKLMVDIVLEKPEEGKSNWTPIGNKETPFKGNFDGNNKTIKNMTIVDSSLDYLGFFGRIKNSTGSKVENLGLLDIKIESINTIGGLVGAASMISIENCYTTGIIKVTGSSRSSVGGLAGWIIGTINGCYSNINIDQCYEAGGLVGTLSGEIKNSFSMGYICAHYAGGIASETVSTTPQKM